ncbi:MAG: hypothetical protein Q9227_003394 [Pyrenula ochraceoflavens]
MQVIPARSGAHASLRKGQKIKVINTHGNQVVDFWAFTNDATSSSTPKYLSMSQTRSALLRVRVSVGDILRDNTRKPILQMVEDTTSGVHDMLFPACDKYRYAMMGVEGFHDSCANNLHTEMKKAGFQPGRGDEWLPDPFNLFMNIPVEGLGNGKGGSLDIKPPESREGQFVVLQAEEDCLVFMSACPQDVVPVNAQNPVEAHFEVS